MQIILKPNLAAFLHGSRGPSLADRFVCFRVGDSMHDLKRASEQIAIVLDRINDVCGHRKFGSATDQVQPLGFEVG